MKTKMKVKKGFTLIELIVVMAIILILSSFLIPRFSGYKEKANKLKAIDTGRQIYAAAFESSIENGNVYSEASIKKAAHDLVGIENVGVSSASETETDISYSIDNKSYTLKVKDNDYYTIESPDEGKIYPIDEANVEDEEDVSSPSGGNTTENNEKIK